MADPCNLLLSTTNKLTYLAQALAITERGGATRRRVSHRFGRNVDALDHQLLMSAVEEALLHINTYRSRLEPLRRAVCARAARSAIEWRIGKPR